MSRDDQPAVSPVAGPPPARRSVRADLRDGVGHLLLDRPEALNALDLTMVRALDDVLASWQREPGVRRVVVESTSPRAFCAGGDIRAVRERALAGDHAGNLAFFREEYALDLRIAEYPRPYVSVVQGVCMGGGLGITVHGSHRVVTESAVLAMPETGIGFVPDIGSSWFLPRLPGAIGAYLALTGARLSAQDALYCGLATHLVPADRLPELRELLSRPSLPVADALAAVAVWPGGAATRPPEDAPVWRDVSPLAAAREDVDECFSAPALDQLLDRLAARPGAWAADALTALEAASPTSLRTTAELLRDPAQSLAACLRRELDVVMQVTRTPDFAEGVRAALVDRDRAPRWATASLTGTPGLRPALAEGGVGAGPPAV